MGFLNDKEEIAEKCEKNERLLQQLLIQSEALDRHTQEWFHEVQIVPEEIANLLVTHEATALESHKKAIQEQKEWKDRLERDLNFIQKPLARKKSRQESPLGNHWIFVR